MAALMADEMVVKMASKKAVGLADELVEYSDNLKVDL